MHARSGAWRCCDGKGRAARLQCEPLLAATFIVLCWTLNLHWYVLLGSSKKITSRDHWITAFRKSTGVILCDALPVLQRLCANGPLKTAKCECLRSRANCQVRMFVKQLNMRLQQLLAVENKTILQQLKPSTLYMMFQLTLIFYPHHTGMRSEMLYTNAVVLNRGYTYPLEVRSTETRGTNHQIFSGLHTLKFKPRHARPEN